MNREREEARMIGICDGDRLGESKVLRTRKGWKLTVRERECVHCGERYKTVEEREDVRFEMKRLHREEIKKLEDENFGLRRLLQGASGAISSLVEYWKEVESMGKK